VSVDTQAPSKSNQDVLPIVRQATLNLVVLDPAIPKLRVLEGAVRERRPVKITMVEVAVDESNSRDGRVFKITVSESRVRKGAITEFGGLERQIF